MYDFVRDILAHNIVGTAAQTAFFLLLALFPFMMAVMSVASRIEMGADGELLDGLFPESVRFVIEGAVSAGDVPQTFTFITLVLSLWSASAGIWALMRGICISYTGRNPNYLRGRMASVAVTAVFLALLAGCLAAWMYGRGYFVRILNGWGMGARFIPAARVFVFLLLFLFMLLIYRTSPGISLSIRNSAPGALVAAAGWRLVSRGFDLYIRTFKDYSVLYGGTGAFLGLAIWLLLISFVILFGAELNASLAKRTNKK